MKLFTRYLKTIQKPLLYFLLCFLVIVFSLRLFQMPQIVIIYPLSLCLVLGILFIAADYRRFYKRVDLIEKVYHNGIEVFGFDEEEKENFSKEEVELLEYMQKQYRQLKSDTFERYNNLVDYYTIWVHQIKTPLTSLKLNLQNQDNEFSRDLMLDVNRVERYVEMVMVYLRLDSLQSDYVFKKYDLDEIVKESVRQFSNEFIYRKISLEYQSHPQVVLTDKKWLSFVVEQLLSNALKYTIKGKITIETSDNSLNITDTGIGIAAEDLSRIFEKGYTGYNGRNNNKSSGLGLYLCKRICDNLSISISVESKVKKGTRLSLIFPKSNSEIKD